MNNKIQRLERILYRMIKELERADCSVGYCCCGGSIESHDNGMLSGHSPVDIGVYNAESLIQEAKEELK